RSHTDPEARIVSLGEKPLVQPTRGRGKTVHSYIPGRDEAVSLSLEGAVSEWCCSVLEASRPRGRKQAPFLRLRELENAYPIPAKKPFATFLKSREWNALRAAGL